MNRYHTCYSDTAKKTVVDGSSLF